MKKGATLLKTTGLNQKSPQHLKAPENYAFAAKGRNDRIPTIHFSGGKFVGFREVIYILGYETPNLQGHGSRGPVTPSGPLATK